MKKRIVVALGGNALGSTLAEQMKAVRQTVKVIADLVEMGHEVVLTHGNGPQVGMINLAMSELHRADPRQSIIPMSVCVAMSQGYIGYDLQSLLRTELLNRDIDKHVTTVITQVRVDEDDPAFKHPDKPIGRFMTREEVRAAEKEGCAFVEDSGRGYRRVVASPKPREIMEVHTVLTLLNAGEIVIAAGGGGIPVVRRGNDLKGVGAVVDWLLMYCGSQLGFEIHLPMLAASLVAVWLIVNEIISILENIGDIGVPLPGFLTKIVQGLKSKIEGAEE